MRTRVAVVFLLLALLFGGVSADEPIAPPGTPEAFPEYGEGIPACALDLPATCVVWMPMVAGE